MRPAVGGWARVLVGKGIATDGTPGAGVANRWWPGGTRALCGSRRENTPRHPRLVRPVNRKARELTRHAQVLSDIRAATTSRAGYPGRTSTIRRRD
jgi:hypothetical protein